MPRNVEIKARVDNIQSLHELAKSVSQSSGTVINQEDTFFVTPKGRLKLRELQGEPSQLIYYERPDQTGPKVSTYSITLIEHPDQLKITLGQALGVKGVVKKKRVLYMVGQTRVHVDEVHHLGDFMELEVVLNDDQSPEEGDAIAHDLMKQLGVAESNLITGAYMDLINKAASKQNGVAQNGE